MQKTTDQEVSHFLDVTGLWDGIMPMPEPHRTTFLNAIKEALDDAKTKARQWVPCSERMPEVSVPVIVCSPVGVVQWITWFWNGKMWHCEGSENVDPIERDAISHWMPLPDRPTP